MDFLTVHQDWFVVGDAVIEMDTDCFVGMVIILYLLDFHSEHVVILDFDTVYCHNTWNLEELVQKSRVEQLVAEPDMADLAGYGITWPKILTELKMFVPQTAMVVAVADRLGIDMIHFVYQRSVETRLDLDMLVFVADQYLN